MIKSVTKINETDYQRNQRTMGAEVTVEGNGLEIMHEFIGIMDALEKSCPEILLKAMQLHMEDKRNDN